MALQWIDAVRNNLLLASNSYADIQRQLDRYNKIFETYANASPETQMRAASVMRQALNEYNGLKKQQVENALKIFEAQQWTDYYRNNTPQWAQSVQAPSIETSSTPQPIEQANIATEQVPVVTTATPWVLNNNAPTTNVEVNAVDTNQTMNVSSSVGVPKSTINPTAPIWNTPKYPNTTIWPVTKRQTQTIKWPNYGPGGVVPAPGTWWYLIIPSAYRTTNSNSLSNTLQNYIRKGARFLYNYLTR